MAKRKKGSKLAKVMSVPMVHTRKRYLKKHERFEPCYLDVDHWFRIINRDVFDGKLEDFRRTEIKRRRNFWGECEGKYDKGGITRYCNLSMNHYFKSLQHFIETLAHEMVHAAEWQFEEKMTHGISFLAWAPKLAQYNIKLSE